MCCVTLTISHIKINKINTTLERSVKQLLEGFNMFNGTIITQHSGVELAYSFDESAVAQW